MARYRSKDSEPVVNTAGYRFTSIESGYSYPSPPREDSRTFIGRKTMIDEVTPGYFRTRKKGGLLPANPMRSESIEHAFTDCSGRLVVDVSNSISRVYEVWGYWGSISSESAVLPSVDEYDLLQEALARARTEAWDILTFAAEFRKTLEMVITARERFTKYREKYLEIVAKKWRRGYDLEKLMSDVWLEVRYGWRPLFYDMADIAASFSRLQAGVEQPLVRKYASGDNVASRTVVGRPGVSWQYWGGSIAPNYCYAQTDVTSRATRKVHCSVGVQMKYYAAVMADPVVTAWELVPFSFVADWFVNVGDALAAFSPFAAGDLRFATVAVEDEIQDQCLTHFVPFSAQVREVPTPASYVRWTRLYGRSNRNPQFNLSGRLDLGVFKVLDLAALWRQLDRNRMRSFKRLFLRT